MPTPDVDFGHTNHAEANRLTKAKTIALWCWDRALARADVEAWDTRRRGQAARAAGVNPPGKDSPTWDLVGDLLDALPVAADRDPWAGWVWRRSVGERDRWTR